MDIVFFFYGLAFFILGVTVLAQPRRENSSDLVRSMWLLGLFGILHAFCEWTYLLDLSRGPEARYEVVHLFLGGGSFMCLFEFGRRVLRLALRIRSSRLVRWTEARYAYLLLLLAAAGHFATPGPTAAGIDIWLRYAVAFPGALAAAVAFLLLARTKRAAADHATRRTFGSLGHVLAAYALLVVVAAPAPFFPAHLINTETFRELFGIPVQVPRAAVAWIVAVAVGTLFHLFHGAARRELQNAVTEANRLRLRSEMILETTDDAICGVDRSGRITFANPAAGRLLGCPAAQLLDRPFSDFRPDPADDEGDHGPEFPCPVPHRSDTEQFVREDGGRFPVEYSSTPRYDCGQLNCAVLAFRDITRRRESEQAARWEQQERFRAVFEQAAAGIALVGLDGRCLQVNHRLCAILGRPPERLLATPFDHFVHAEERAACLTVKEGLVRDERPPHSVLEVRCHRGDRKTVWVQLAFSMVRDQSGAPMYCVLVVDDITERKAAEAALLRSRADLERSQRIARLGSWELDLQRELRMNWSGQALEVLGWNPQAQPPDLGQFLSMTHPGNRAQMEAAVEGWFGGRGRRNMEYRIRRPDGEQRFVDLSVRFEHAPDGSPAKVVGTIQDITERKRTEQVLEFYRNRLEQLVEERTAELRASNRELASANRELESFSYSVSHDLRSPLRAINGFTQALVEDYGERLNDEALCYIGRVRSATVRMGELIDGLLNLARVYRSQFDADRVDLSACAGDIVRQLRAGEPGRPISVDIQPALIATGDPTLLRLLLQNLIGNAWKFTRDRSDPKISIGREAGGESGPFYVRDNGVGFEMEYAHQLFQPFQRLHAHDDYDGTGIGLATVRRIVQRHGGRVWAEGKPGIGATIYFTLEPEAAEIPPPDETGAGMDEA